MTTEQAPDTESPLENVLNLLQLLRDKIEPLNKLSPGLGDNLEIVLDSIANQLENNSKYLPQRVQKTLDLLNQLINYAVNLETAIVLSLYLHRFIKGLDSIASEDCPRTIMRLFETNLQNYLDNLPTDNT